MNTRDRRPVAAINTWRGDPGNPIGLHPKWEGGEPVDQAKWLHGQVEAAFDAGYRRFVLILPAGNARTINADGSKTIMSGNQYRTLSDQKKDAIALVIQAWTHRDATCSFGVYCGFDIDVTPGDLDFREHRVPDFGSHVDRAEMVQQHASLRLLGFKELWWDFASTPERRAQAILFGQWFLAEYGLLCHGEAVPRNWPAPDGKLDPVLSPMLGWMALLQYYRGHDSQHQWIAPDDVCMYVGIQAGKHPTFDELRSFAQRGFIPFVYSKSLYDIVTKAWAASPAQRT